MKAVSGAMFALVLGAVTPVLAQAPVPPPQLAKPGAPAPAGAGAGAHQVAVPGVSAAGNAALTRLQAKPDPVLPQLASQMQNVNAQLALAVQAPTMDVDKFAALLKQREGLQAQLSTRTDDRLLAALRALPPGDRGAFMKALTQRAPAGAGGR